MEGWKLITIGVVVGIALSIAINTWGGSEALDDSSSWLRKTTGTELTAAERLGNRANEFVDTLQGEESISRSIRKMPKCISDVGNRLIDE